MVIAPLKNKVTISKNEIDDRYKILVEASPNGVVTVNKIGIVTFCNPTFLKLTGYSESEIIGKHISKLPTIRKKDIPKYLKILISAFKGDKLSEIKFLYITKSGEERFGAATISVIKHEGKILELMLLLRDITDEKNTKEALKEGEKKAEDSLRMSERKYRTIFENMNDSMIIHDFKGKIIDFNKNLMKLIGYKKREEIMNMGLADFQTKASVNLIKKRMDILKNKKILTFNVDFIDKNRKIIPVSVSAKWISKEDNGIIQSFIRDITQQKEDKNLLKESKKDYKTLFDNALFPIVRVRIKDGKAINVNKACVKLFGYLSEVEFIEKFFSPKHYVNPEERKKVIKVLKQKGHIDNIKMHLKKKDGIKIWVEASFKLDSKNKYIDCVFINITEREKAEEKLKEERELLKQVGEINKIGGWEMDMANGGSGKWTKATYDIVEIDYHKPIPGFDEHVNYYLPEYRKMVREKMQKLLVKKEKLYFQAQLKTEKNNIKWVEAHGKALTEDGKVVKLQGTFQDITDRKKSEKGFIERSAQLQAIMDNTNDWIFIKDKDSKFILSNKSHRKLLGESNNIT